MKIVLFGGGGFIGSAVTDRLLRDGHDVRIFERPRVAMYREFGNGERLEWVAGDMQSPHDLASAIDGMDVVLHLASSTLPKNSNEDSVFDVQSNLVTTLQLLNAMVAGKVGKIIFISSGGTVYGEPKYLPIDELHPTNPLVSYGIIKLAIEKYMLLYERMHGIRTTILRVSNAYGERQRVETAQGAVSVFLHRALQGQAIEIWGDGSTTRDFIYVQDVADAFAKALEYEGQARILNISSGAGVSLKNLVLLLEESIGRRIEMRYLPGRPFDVPASVLSNELAKRELAWVPRVQLPEGIGLTGEWIRKTLRSELAAK
jgi:UDP-glucose 4-epimerase